MLETRIAQTVFSGGIFGHGFTCSGHPVAAAAALAAIEFYDSGVLQNVQRVLAPQFNAEVERLKTHGAVGDVRSYGMMAAVELVPKGGRAALEPGLLLGVKAAGLCMEESLVVRGIGNFIALCPPLIINSDEISLLFARLGTALDKLAAQS